MNFEEMQAKLESRLKPSRFKHSLGVAETAVALAKRFHVDEAKAQIAGLLHDCGRQYENYQLLYEAEKRNIYISPLERAMPLLLHGYIGARLIMEEYDIYDDDIAHAIYCHTVAAENMNALDKIIYFADMIEPGREYPGVDKLRDLAQAASLDEMVLAGLSQSISFVVNRGHLIHPTTILARNELILSKIED